MYLDAGTHHRRYVKPKVRDRIGCPICGRDVCHSVEVILPMANFSFYQLYCELNRTQWGGNYVLSPVGGLQERDTYEELLLPHLGETLGALEPLRAYGDAQARHWRKQHTGSAYEDQHQLNLWQLYALSRVSDLLLVPFTPVGDPAQVSSDDEIWRSFPLRMEERTDWFVSLGMRQIKATAFHPFYHEIVAVEQSPDPEEPITLVETIWPGFMLGQMLFCRAGVKVRGGAQHIVKQIAETSTLYFTYRRTNRPTSDLSHGWGSNSQWGTDFRRDYEDAAMFYYNVDRAVSVDEPYPFSEYDQYDAEDQTVSLTRDQRIELLTHRCFIVTDKPHGDLWPFDFTYEEPQHRQ
jgi:hypothetical protein